jgi:Flp pilus assembly protein TadB
VQTLFTQSPMYIIVIGWIYVVFMIAVVSDSLLKGFIRFFFLGVIPVGLWMWMSLRKARQQKEAAARENASPPSDTANY